MCLKTYELDSAHFYHYQDHHGKKKKNGNKKQTNQKNKNKSGIELELLTDFDMLLMVEKGIRGGICHAIPRYAKANNKYMKYYEKDKELSYIQY